MSQAIGNSYNSAFNPTEHLVGTGDDLDKDAFLMLLVTQFQYQDPLNPAEDTEFVAQLAQFSSLEHMMNMTDSMDGLVVSQNKQLTVSSSQFIGKDVSARGFGVSVQDGTISSIRYAHDVDIASGSVNIFNESKQLVASVKLPSTSAGVHNFEWNGRLADGTVAPNGVYTIAISAKDAQGNGVITDAQVSGRVDAVSTYNGDQFLRLTDGRVVSLGEVHEILEPKEIEKEDKEDEDEDDLTTDKKEDKDEEDLTTDEKEDDGSTGA